MKSETELPLIQEPATPKMMDVSPEYAEIMMLGNVLHKSGYFKDLRDQAQAVTKILFGRELGFSPIVAISGIHIIEGKPSLSSNLMATLIKRSGVYDYRVKTWTDTACVLMFRQRESKASPWEEIGESSFTQADATKAGVWGKNTWSKYPKAMLFARALSQGLRVYCPDVSASPIYCPEEMGAEVNEEGDVLQLPKSARAVEVTTEPTPLPASGPAKVAADKPANLPPKGSEPPEPKAAPFSPVHGGAPLPTQGNSGDPSDEYIELGRQTNIHRQFKDSIRNAAAQKQADTFLSDWLKAKGFIGEDGRGTTKKIKVSEFAAIREEAVAYAASLPA